MAKKVNSPFSDTVRLKVKGYLGGFIEGLLQELRRSSEKPQPSLAEHSETPLETPLLKPFHDALLPANFQLISAFERSFSIRLGSTFEEAARLIAEAYQ
ncbi:MAG: TdeIII family type II restriction endonuclease [Bacteroidia bacterium]|nr:TdeIII family type II restriction endonuclease [Bacteroidia bacterium]